MSTQPTPLYSTLALVNEFGRHVGYSRRCSCCGLFTLYCVQYVVGLPAFLCSTCDTEKDGAK